MELSEFHYDLPKSLIAAYPTRNREASRLLVLRRPTGEIIHSRFSDLAEFLDAGDLLVVNYTKVFPARLRGRKESGGEVELLLLERFPGRRTLWIVLIKAAKKPRVGSWVRFGDRLTAEVIGDMNGGRFGVEFHNSGDFAAEIEAIGEAPLPPYIQRKRAAESLDRDRYQTVYAAKPGAIAAPTAGFHFTPQLFDKLEAKGIGRTLLTLHVGPGTFQPIRESTIEQHTMEGERYSLTAAAAANIRHAKESGRRVVAVGSTSTRTLEWIAREKGGLQADQGIARLFIRPGDSFRVIDALITNLHLPDSTPLVLVVAFAGMELVRRAYAEAIQLKYGFYSYGDAMLIL